MPIIINTSASYVDPIKAEWKAPLLSVVIFRFCYMRICNPTLYKITATLVFKPLFTFADVRNLLEHVLETNKGRELILPCSEAKYFDVTPFRQE